MGAAPPVARRGGRLLTETELLERFRGRTELSLEAIGAGPTWRSYAARTQFDERGLLTEATRRLVARYGYFALHLLEDVDDLPDLLEAEGADPQPDPDGTYWSQQDDDPRTRGWVALRAHGNLVVSAHLDVRSSGDTHWSEVTDLAGRLAHS